MVSFDWIYFYRFRSVTYKFKWRICKSSTSVKSTLFFNYNNLIVIIGLVQGFYWDSNMPICTTEATNRNGWNQYTDRVHRIEFLFGCLLTFGILSSFALKVGCIVVTWEKKVEPFKSFNLTIVWKPWQLRYFLNFGSFISFWILKRTPYPKRYPVIFFFFIFNTFGLCQLLDFGINLILYELFMFFVSKKILGSYKFFGFYNEPPFYLLK